MKTQPFTATVTGSANAAVNWSIDAGGAGGINATGLYTAPSPIAALTTVTVKATSQADLNHDQTFGALRPRFHVKRSSPMRQETSLSI